MDALVLNPLYSSYNIPYISKVLPSVYYPIQYYFLIIYSEEEEYEATKPTH